MIDLAAEWRCALAAMTIEIELDLIDCGIPAELFRRGKGGEPRYYHRLVGLAHVDVARGRYQPHPDGTGALVTPVRREVARSFASLAPAGFVRWGVLLELVCWHPATPGAWALRSGDSEADWLGLVDYPYFEDGPVPIWRGPFGWLRAGAVGLVPLCREALDVLPALRAGFRGEDYAHQRDLEGGRL